MNPQSPATLLVTGIYYALVLVLSVFSIFGVYLLIRYGRSRSLSLSIALAYSIFFLVLLSQSYSLLQSLSL